MLVALFVGFPDVTAAALPEGARAAFRVATALPTAAMLVAVAANAAVLYASYAAVASTVGHLARIRGNVRAWRARACERLAAAAPDAAATRRAVALLEALRELDDAIADAAANNASFRFLRCVKPSNAGLLGFGSVLITLSIGIYRLVEAYRLVQGIPTTGR